MSNEVPGWRIACHRLIEYDIVHSPDLFSPQNGALLSVGRVDNSRRFVVMDSNVYRLYSDKVSRYFAEHNVDARIVPFPGGEENKSVERYLAILHELDDFPIHRRDEPIIAIGGGVLTDTVGFVASSYRRGIPHINVPTTLMGYVDASVGIKTGINLDGCKNRLGSFHPPVKVLLDRAFLKTLPKRHILNGVGEIIKLAVIKDLELFELLERHGSQAIHDHFQEDAGQRILDRAISGMVDELEPNLFEEDLARKMDFGHTFIYGFEACEGSTLLHGEAVLLDIALSVVLARARNYLSADECNRIFDLFDTLEIELVSDILEPSLLWLSLEERVYHRNGSQRVPLPQGIGRCIFINDLSPSEISASVERLQNRLSAREERIP